MMDCGLPYLCSKSGCNETQLKVPTAALVALKPFQASRAPCVMAESLGSQVKSNRTKEKKKRRRNKHAWWNGFDSISKSENRNLAEASVSTLLSAHSKLFLLSVATTKAPHRRPEKSTPPAVHVFPSSDVQNNPPRWAVLSQSCKR